MIQLFAAGSLGPVWDITTFVLIVSSLLGGGLFAEQRRRKRAPLLADTPILMSYYSEGKVMVPAKSGTVGGMKYSGLVAMSMGVESNVASSISLTYRVELPFNTSIHLICVPKVAGIVQLDPSQGGVMERVSLEGNYDNFFSLYCEKGMQTQTRYVMDPKAMLFTLDFCRSHSWEIIGSELYLTQSGGKTTGDPTDMFDDIVRFVEEIKPALARPLTEKEEQARASYGEDRRTQLKCPICKSLLENKRSYFQCPHKDGILINGSKLNDLRNGALLIDDYTSLAVPRHNNILNCPSCDNAMEQVAYNWSGTVIDTCSQCPYRWLDRGELARPG